MGEAGDERSQGEGNPWRGRMLMLTTVHTAGTACYLSIMAMGPLVREDLDITAAQFGFFLSAIYFAQLICALPSGAITDRMGVGWTLLGASVMMAVGSVVFALSTDFSFAVAGSFLIGLGYAFVNPATAKAVVRWFPAEWRGTAMGLKQLGVPLGGVAGAGGGIVAAYIEWRYVLFGFAFVTFATSFLWLAYTRRPQLGAGSFAAAISDLKTVILNRNMNIICASSIAFNVGQSSLFSYLALFLKDAAMATQPVAAAGVAFAQSASAIGRVGYSYLSDTLTNGRRRGVTVSVILLGAGTCLIAYFVNPQWPHWGLMLLATIMGGTIASYAALILAMTAETVPSRVVGSAIGYNAVAWSLGGMFGPPLFGLVLDYTGGDYGIGWLVVGAIMIIGAGLMALQLKENK